ncbi:threonine synthase [Maricaulis maris]|uniref:Threonine synthase n=1 Tax=Maricaulis maris TaxID=74318 RepID=A0A495D2B7_9PROT|nr:threonine synthase [Maricaulis maris]RKQ95685.1 L-threonine synthase [Maricaulis maris]
MKYRSTRGQAPIVDAGQALRAGVAPDGGLYMPQSLPHFSPADFSDTPDLASLAGRLLSPFFTDSELDGAVPGICADAFDFPVPRVRIGTDDTAPDCLELFHGPTGAFKDFGARFLFRAFGALGQNTDAPATVLVATSGDTGGAVGCAAEGVTGTRAIILFPAGRISPFQEHQLCCWKAPVEAARVSADFDACQALVKSAFADTALAARHNLTSANSISIGRFLPQMSYWARAALDTFAETGTAPGLIIPTGNLGNAFAAILARACGLPIGPIILATNANATLADWFAGGDYAGRASIATLANAMDVGAPSNFERLSDMPAGQVARVEQVEDNDIRHRIRTIHDQTGYVACPHTATALEAWHRLDDVDRAARHWLIGATAHPAKFADTVEPLIGQSIKLPPMLKAALNRPVRSHDLRNELGELARLLEEPA